MNTFLALVTGVVLRLFVPLIVTALIVYVLHKLDARWQVEAESEHAQLIKDEMPCWKEQGLFTDEIKKRSAGVHSFCWQSHRLVNGYLSERCLHCEVFLSAPLPNPVHSHVHL